MRQINPKPIDLSAHTSVQRLRSLSVARAIRDGSIHVPLTCGWCEATSIERRFDHDAKRFVVHCFACSRETSLETAHTLRRQKIRRMIIDGTES